MTAPTVTRDVLADRWDGIWNDVSHRNAVGLRLERDLRDLIATVARVEFADDEDVAWTWITTRCTDAIEVLVSEAIVSGELEAALAAGRFR